MCPPVIALLGFAVSAASSIAGFAGQQQQYQAQMAQYEQNKKNAEQAFADNQSALNQREEQIQAADGQKRQEDSLATTAAQATATAAGASGGVEGISMEGILGDFGARNARADAAINTQEGWNIAQTQSEKVGAADQQVSRINSVQYPQQPSFADAAVRIASGGLSAYNQFQQSKVYGAGGGGMFGGFSPIQTGSFN